MADEFICDTPEVRSFVGKVKAIVDRPGSIAEKLITIRPHFREMMVDSTWLPEEFRRTPDYDLIPLSGDIHRVITTGNEPSISLHLLTNDVGCVLRHRFESKTGEVALFRSGYTNLDCEAEARKSRGE